jgi:tRNA A-37 threonylcarbamoyl transferase component Bud32
MFLKVVGLVAGLHERNVAHCDVKMGNVLLKQGELVLSDFGESMIFGDSEQSAILQGCRCVHCSVHHGFKV